MRVGSLVQCIGDITKNIVSIEVIQYYNLSYPVINEVYEVREINGEYIRLQEIVNRPIEKYRNDPSSGFTEVEFHITGFREVQPPMDISEIFSKELEECIVETI